MSSVDSTDISGRSDTPPQYHLTYSPLSPFDLTSFPHTPSLLSCLCFPSTPSLILPSSPTLPHSPSNRTGERYRNTPAYASLNLSLTSASTHIGESSSDDRYCFHLLLILTLSDASTGLHYLYHRSLCILSPCVTYGCLTHTPLSPILTSF